MDYDGSGTSKHLALYRTYLLVVAIDKAVTLTNNYLVFIQRGFTVHCIILSEYNKYVLVVFSYLIEFESLYVNLCTINLFVYL